jgi:hypothetical protein
MRVLCTRLFSAYATQRAISDRELIATVGSILYSGASRDFGGELVLHRIRRGSRASTGARAVVALRSVRTAVFLMGLDTSDRWRPGDRDTRALRDLGRLVLDFDDESLRRTIDRGVLLEVPADVEHPR